MGRFKDTSIDALAKRFCKICPYCDRKVPSISFFTRHGCLWCEQIAKAERKSK